MSRLIILAALLALAGCNALRNGGGMLSDHAHQGCPTELIEISPQRFEARCKK